MTVGEEEGRARLLGWEKFLLGRGRSALKPLISKLRWRRTVAAATELS